MTRGRKIVISYIIFTVTPFLGFRFISVIGLSRLPLKSSLQPLNLITYITLHGAIQLPLLSLLKKKAREYEVGSLVGLLIVTHALQLQEQTFTHV